MKVKVTAVFEADSFEAIPSMVYEFREALHAENDNGTLLKRDSDKTTWKTEFSE